MLMWFGHIQGLNTAVTMSGKVENRVDRIAQQNRGNIIHHGKGALTFKAKNIILCGIIFNTLGWEKQKRSSGL